MSVGLVIVSHSSKIAEGVVELAAQMAGSTTIIAAGGTDEGGIGTSFDRVTEAILQAAEAGGIAGADGGGADGGGADGGGADGGGVVVLCDLGSAILTAETALDFLDDSVRARVRIADAPLVEGAVAAAVAAETGGDLTAVVTAAVSANASMGATEGAGAATDTPPEASASGASASEASASGAPVEDVVRAEATLVNPSGLHARPAASFVKLASTFDAVTTVNGVDARSLLRIMSLGLGVGTRITITGTGPEADAAVSSLVELVNSGFGE